MTMYYRTGPSIGKQAVAQRRRGADHGTQRSARLGVARQLIARVGDVLALGRESSHVDIDAGMR